MKTVFICSPFRGNEKENAEKAKFYARIAIGTGAVPIVPHLYFPMFLDEKKPAERMQGIEMGLELMDCCDEVWVFGFNITSGMQFELDHARDTKVPVRLYDKDMNRINLRTLRIDERATPDYMVSIKGLKLLK